MKDISNSAESKTQTLTSLLSSPLTPVRANLPTCVVNHLNATFYPLLSVTVATYVPSLVALFSLPVFYGIWHAHLRDYHRRRNRHHRNCAFFHRTNVLRIRTYRLPSDGSYRSDYIRHRLFCLCFCGSRASYRFHFPSFHTPQRNTFSHLCV